MTEKKPQPEPNESNVWEHVCEFKFLIVVYLLIVPAVVWEFSQSENADLYLDPDNNYTDTIVELYPDTGESYYARARQVVMCYRKFNSGENSFLCNRYQGRRREDVKKLIRDQFELAIDSGLKDKHNETLYLEYLIFLLDSGADEEDIQAAHKIWRERYPVSTQADPLLTKSPERPKNSPPSDVPPS